MAQLSSIDLLTESPPAPHPRKMGEMPDKSKFWNSIFYVSLTYFEPARSIGDGFITV